MTASRTINPLHFEDLEPHRFEDLVRQLAYDFRRWRLLEPTGRVGKDEGLDIRGLEAVLAEPLSDDDVQDADVSAGTVFEREWRIQCKRMRRIGPTSIRQIVGEALRPEGSDPPYGLIVAAACDVSGNTLAAFHAEATERGVQEHYLWTKAQIEDLLFRPENDRLLFAYFGFSLGIRRRSRLQDVRARIALKRKLLRAFDVESLSDRVSKPAVVRDIDDDSFPFEGEDPDFASLPFPPWHRIWVEGFDWAGLIVVTHRYFGWLGEGGIWDIAEHREEIRKRGDDGGYEEWQRLRALVPDAEQGTVSREVLLPFDLILEADPMGDLGLEDSFGNEPHLFCRFVSRDFGPYARRADRDHLWERWAGRAQAQMYGPDRELLPENRRPLFSTPARPKRRERQSQS